MLRQSVKSVSILLKYAPWLTALKLLQIVVSAVLAPLSIYFMQRIIDIVSGVITNGDSVNGLFIWAGFLMLSMLFSSIGGGFLNGILHISTKRRLNIGMTPDIVEKFKRIDYACFEDKDVHDTLERMSSDPQDKVYQLFLTITGVIESTIGVIGAALIFAQVGLWFVAGFFVLLVPMIWLDFKASDIMNEMFNNQSIDERRMHYLGGLLSNKASLFELKIFRATGYIAAKWRGIAKTVLDERVKTTIHAQKYNLLSTIVFKTWSFFIVASLVYSIARGDITIGLFTALIASTGAVLDNCDLLAHIVQNLRARYLLMEHYYKFIALPEVSDGSAALPDGPAHIVFEDVVFAYPKTDTVVLNGVSFDVKPHERVSIVGENGAGKSTIIKLLCRLYTPDSGRILINGRDIRELSQSELRRTFSVVFQDFQRYALTLRENVALGDIEKLRCDEKLRSALKMGLANGLPDLDAPLGKLEEDGVDLSGGQWQRVAIARACLPDSAFVILDEPTAALDPVAESEMYHSFSRILKNRGCVLISHRLASAKMADKIIVLDGGVVAEQGGHAELMDRHGLYRKMFDSQSAWYAQGTQGGEII